jgi:MFS family permease
MFLNIWLAFTLSEFGSSVALVVLPLVAATLLHAVPLQMSVIASANTLPFLVLGPLAGVLADRLPRRAILISADVTRAVVLATAVIVALNGALTMGIVYGVAFGMGIGNVWFDIAHGSYVPSVVLKEHLIAANSPGACGPRR